MVTENAILGQTSHVSVTQQQSLCCCLIKFLFATDHPPATRMKMTLPVLLPIKLSARSSTQLVIRDRASRRTRAAAPADQLRSAGCAQPSPPRGEHARGDGRPAFSTADRSIRNIFLHQLKTAAEYDCKMTAVLSP